ncbi:MAG: hypothetical protein ACXWC8_00235 [Limisphaerales bacterium]
MIATLSSAPGRDAKTMYPVNGSLHDWISYVFDHPVNDALPAWYWDIDVPVWEGTPEQITQYISETFQNSGELLARFSDEQLNQGFWFLVSGSCSEFMYALRDEKVPLPMRLRALRSFVPVFEQVMARRCSPHLSHLDEAGTNALNSACYMWWDHLPIHGEPENPARAAFDSEVLAVLRRILAIPHDACRESALHGIGHWVTDYPEAAEIVDDFLAGETKLRPELVGYALAAKDGNVL